MLKRESAGVSRKAAPCAATVRKHRLAVVVFIAMLIVLAAALFKPWIHGTDGTRNYAYLRSVLIDGDLHFQNEFEHYAREGEYQGAVTPDSPSGHISTPVGSGSAVLWSPFVLVAHGAALVGPWEADGYSAPYVYGVSLGSLFYGILGLALLYAILLQRFGIAPASIASAAILFGSPLWFYLYLHPSMSHACSFFLCTLMVWEYEKWREHPRLYHFALMGLTCGLAMATRFNNGVFLLLAAGFLIRAGREQKVQGNERFWSFLAIGGALMGLGLIVGFAPQAVSWKILHGSFLSGPQDAGADLTQTFTLWKSPHALQILFSGRHGLFVWTPVLFVAMAGWVWLFIKG
ncbi:MAG: glycosyltransferase family 39 protein, partial [Candidatus Sumerlaeota bacterium]